MSDITIIMPLFNKEKYISQALDSVFMQETSYDYHIIAADDNSSDNTVNIVKNYQAKYPDKITLLTSDVNQKLYKNVLRAYALTKTDYFCVLDGDDFWIDKHKIQKALDFLEKHKDYTIYVTDTILQNPDGTRTKYIKRKKIIDSDFNDFLNKKAALGCTLGSTFRNVIFKNGLPDKMINLASTDNEQSFRGDSFRSVIHLQKGKAHCVPFEDAVYRVTKEGLWQGSSKLSQGLLTANFNKDMWFYFDKKYPQFLLKSYFTFNSLKHDLFEFIELSDNDEKTIETINKIKALSKIYKENSSLIEELTNKYTPIRYKIQKSAYIKLSEKLKRKGLI